MKKTYESKRDFECYQCMTVQRRGEQYVRAYFSKDRDGRRQTVKVCLSCAKS